MGQVHSKLWYQSVVCRNGLRSGEIFQNTAADEMQTKILEEIMAVVKAKGIKAPKKDMITYVKDLSSSRYNKPSMLQHIEAGRLTEIDSLNGAVVSEAKALNISVLSIKLWLTWLRLGNLRCNSCSKNHRLITKN